MIYRDNASGAALDADVCIIGGGPAAISVALRLVQSMRKIVVLVGGGETRESTADQDLHRGIVRRQGSHEGLEENRRRQFGGATSAWGGRCIPFDPIDFEERSWIRDSGWPVTYAEMEGFFCRAMELCRAGAFEFDARKVFPQKGPEIILGMDDGDLESWHLERWSPPVNFAIEYGPTLELLPNVGVYLNSHLLFFCCEERKERISVAHAISSGSKFEVRAETFVLATGGIENARLLLASRGPLHPAGLGNDRDLVGRYYQCHPHGTFAVLSPRNRSEIHFEYERDSDGVYCRRRWGVSKEAQQRLQIGNIILFLDRAEPAFGRRDPLFSAVFLAKALLRIARTRGGKRSFDSCGIRPSGSIWRLLSRSVPAFCQPFGELRTHASRRAEGCLQSCQAGKVSTGAFTSKQNRRRTRTAVSRSLRTRPMSMECHALS